MFRIFVQLLGGKKKTWSAVVDHAKECVVDDNKLYAFQKHEHDVILVFDSIYRVTGAFFAGHFRHLDQFNPSQMVTAQISFPSFRKKSKMDSI